MKVKSFIWKKIFLFAGIFCILVLYDGCKKNENEPKGSQAYIASIEKWHKERIENLKKEDGWLNLIGLYWLKNGENKIGSDSDNDIIFPADKAPNHIGTIVLSDSIAKIIVKPGVSVTCNGKPVTEMRLFNDGDKNPTVLVLGSLRWFIIKRDDKYGIRLRDVDAPLVQDFNGIDTFPINEDWKINAKFKPYSPPKIITIPSIIGTMEEDTVRGFLLFNVKGVAYKLDPVEEGNQLFIIFADETSGEETYGAGRFLYADKPDSSGNVILDFNKAYNPPCAFTPYATCPLPPKQNYLHLKITAGEKKYGDGHH